MAPVAPSAPLAALTPEPGHVVQTILDFLPVLTSRWHLTVVLWDLTVVLWVAANATGVAASAAIIAARATLVLRID